MPPGYFPGEVLEMFMPGSSVGGAGGAKNERNYDDSEGCSCIKDIRFCLQRFTEGTVMRTFHMGLPGRQTFQLHILALLVVCFKGPTNLELCYWRNCQSSRKRQNNGVLTPLSSTFAQTFSFQRYCDTSLCSLLRLLCFPAVWKG